MKNIFSSFFLCIFFYIYVFYTLQLNTLYARDFTRLGSITITYPIGGEVFYVGSKPTITYVSIGNSGYVNLDYSTDGGSTWDIIATNQLNDGDYKGWIAPNSPSANCKIKVSDVDGDPVGISNGLFRIQAPVPPISPKWVFEPWVWEDQNNTKDSALACVNGYLDKGIPVGAVLIDSPWEEPIGTFPYKNDETDKGYKTFKFMEGDYYSKPQDFINIELVKDLKVHVIIWMTGNMTTNCPDYNAAKTVAIFLIEV